MGITDATSDTTSQPADMSYKLPALGSVKPMTTLTFLATFLDFVFRLVRIVRGLIRKPTYYIHKLLTVLACLDHSGQLTTISSDLVL